MILFRACSVAVVIAIACGCSAAIDRSTDSATSGPRIGGPFASTGIGPAPILPPGGRPEQRVPFPSISDWNSLRIRLERTACLGDCADYTVEIHGDGAVLYEGRHAVAVPGRHSGKIPHATVQKLFEKFREAEYFWSLDRYESPATDLPAYRTSIAFDGHQKTVTDYAGLAVGMPKVLAELEVAIDAAAGTRKWLEVTDESVPSLIDEDYFRRPGSDGSVMTSMILRGATPTMVRRLISSGAPIDASGKDLHDQELTPLMAAAIRGNNDIANVLLDSGALTNVHHELDSALSLAAGSGALPLIRTLLTHGANAAYREESSGWTVLMAASASGVPGAVAAVLRIPQDVNARTDRGETALMYAASVEVDLKHPRGFDPAKVIRMLAAAGANVNSCVDSIGGFALAWSSAAEVTKALLEVGADPNLRCPSTALEMTFFPEVATVLLEGGADPSSGPSEVVCRRGFQPEVCAVVRKWVASHPAGRKH